MGNDGKPVTISRLRQMKEKREPIAMLTAYDFPTAQLAESSGADIVLVGDSLGNVVLGYESTVPVTLDDMVHHTRAARRGLNRSFLVADLPFLTYRTSVEEALKACGRLMQQGGAKAVKMEGGAELAPVVRAAVTAGVPVMGHIGLKPQTVYQTGYRVQGKTEDSVKELKRDAEALVAAGVFALVLECVTEEAAQAVTEAVPVPTIGIGSGRYCDGQVLVFHDVVQFGLSAFRPSFVKAYAEAGRVMLDGLTQYVNDVKGRRFPEPQHVFRQEPVYGGEKR